jgi:hypothetical protein
VVEVGNSGGRASAGTGKIYFFYYFKTTTIMHQKNEK